ncbi:MAG: 4Fe-4S dicluster domain-containing protein [Planctomycetes bacterium]|nr:4Fe-4S dicluster domain-containing protein [Planctomycetota bacterium]
MKKHETDLKRRRFLRFALYNAAGVCVGSLAALARSDENHLPGSLEELKSCYWGFVVDTTLCIGCGSCVRACKTENHVPDTYYRTWVERYEIDEREQVHVDSPKGALESFKADFTTDAKIAKAFFVPKLCNHCTNSACTQVCPVGASYHSPDGVVLVDRKHCVGCGYCIQACPYGCRYISHPPGTADKCTLCYHRIHRGLPTACVQACPREARICGDLNDPDSRIRKILRERRYNLLKPDLGTNPKCFYIGLDLEVR